MRKHSMNWIALLLALALALGGCGAQTDPAETAGPEPDPAQTETPQPVETEPQVLQRQSADGVFTVNFDPNASVNPVRAESVVNMELWSLIYDSAFYLDESFNVRSDVISSYSSDDYIWWVFQVRTDLRFADGSPLTARDVAYSISTARNADYYKGRLGLIVGVSALDASSFAITTSYANSMLPALLTVPIIKRGDYYNNTPLGSGPYWFTLDRSALEPNIFYRYAGELPLDTIYLRDYTDASARITAYEDASLDIVTNDPTGVYNVGYGSSNDIRFFDTANLHFLGVNQYSRYFSSAEARAALTYLVNRSYIAGALMGTEGGVPAVLPVHPRSQLYDAVYAADYAYDPRRAEELLAGSFTDTDEDGVLELVLPDTDSTLDTDIKLIVNNDSPAKLRAARAVADSMNAVGLNTRLYELNWDEYQATLKRGDFDLYYGEVRMGADWNLSYLFRIPGMSDWQNIDWGQNYFRNQDYNYTRLYSAYLAASDTERYERFQELAHYITEHALLVPVCFERRQVLTHRGVVSGLIATQFDLFYNFREWTVHLDP